MSYSIRSVSKGENTHVHVRYFRDYFKYNFVISNFNQKIKVPRKKKKLLKKRGTNSWLHLLCAFRDGKSLWQYQKSCIDLDWSADSLVPPDYYKILSRKEMNEEDFRKECENSGLKLTDNYLKKEEKYYGSNNSV